MNNKRILVIGIAALVFSYIYASTLLFGRILMPGAIELKRYDILDEYKIEQEKKTETEGIFWDSNSYIEYHFTSGRKYIDIELGGSGYRLMAAKLYFGTDGRYEQKYEECSLRKLRHNACKIPKETYNCVRIYPLGKAVDGLNSEELISAYLIIKSISTTDGIPDMLFLYGTTMGIGILFMGMIYIGILCRNSFWFDPYFKHRYLIGISMCFVLIFGLKTIYYPFDGVNYFADSAFYYWSGDSFFKDGKFSLHNYLWTDPEKVMRFRGCMLPLLIYGMKALGNLFGLKPELSYDICSAVFFAVFFAVGLPMFFQEILHKRVALYQILLSLLIFLLFMRGVIVYPLSDMYGAIFSIYAVFGIVKMLRNKNGMDIFWAAVSGISLYLAYNIRAGNLLLVISLALVICFLERKNVKKILKHIMIIAVVMCLVSIPQIIVNTDICEKPSPLVLTEKYKEDGKSLIVTQLVSGLANTRFEAELSAGTRNFVRIYKNPIGEHLFRTYNSQVRSMRDFLGICVKHPLSVCVIWGTHLLVAMDLRFPDVYHTCLVSLNKISFLLNIAFWWLILIWTLRNAGGGYFKEVKKQKIEYVEKIVWFLVPCIPSLAQICGQFEGRFAVTIYILLFSRVSYEFPDESLAGYIKEKKNMCIILYFALIIGLGTIWSLAYANPYM